MTPGLATFPGRTSVRLRCVEQKDLWKRGGWGNHFSVGVDWRDNGIGVPSKKRMARPVY